MIILKDLIEATPELVELKQDYPAISAWLNEAPDIENPDEQGEVIIKPPVTMSGLIDILPRTAKTAILRLPSLTIYLADAYENEAITQSAVDTVAVAFSQIATGDIRFIEAVRWLVENNELGALAALITVMVQNGHLSPETASAIEAEIDKKITVPDPNWRPVIKDLPRYQQLGLPGPVTPEQVQEALN
jgi:hypothetical protein